MIWLPIVVSFFGFLTVIAVIVGCYIFINRGIPFDLPRNATIVRCETRRAFTNGYVEGLLKSAIPRKNKCYLIQFYPIDRNQNEPGKPELQSVVVHESFLEWHDDASSRRTLLTIKSRDPLDVPRSMRDTENGKWLSKEGQLAHIERTFHKGITAGDEAIAAAMQNYARGEITKAALASIQEAAAAKERLQGQTATQSPTKPDEKQ